MDLNIFKDIDTVYVTGHKNPDADSHVSSKIMCDILRANGINAVWTFFEGDTAGKGEKLIQDVLDIKPFIMPRSEIGNKKFLLVDHNDVSQSVGCTDNVIAAIDHHVDSGQIKNLFLSDYCCTALYIYMMFKDSYDFSDKQKTQIFRAVLSDSVFGKSSRYKPTDAQAVKALGFDTNYDEYFEKFFVPTDLSKAPEIFGKNGLKSYSFEKAQFVSTYIEATDTKLLCDYRQFVTDYDGDFLGIWIDYTKPNTFVYFKHNGTVHHLTYDCIASRAATIMPQIVKLF